MRAECFREESGQDALRDDRGAEVDLFWFRAGLQIGIADSSGSIEIEIANGFAGVGSFFGFFERFLKFLLEQFGGVFLRLDRLAEDRLAPAVLLFHGFRCIVHVGEHSGLHGSGVRDDGCGCRIHFQNRIAARAGDFDAGRILRHFANHTAKSDALQMGGGQAKRGDSELMLDFDWQNMEDVQQFPREHEDREQNDQYGHHFAEGETAPVWLEAARGESKDVHGRESENDCPQNRIDVVAAAGFVLQKEDSRERDRLNPDGNPPLQESVGRAANCGCREVHELRHILHVESLPVHSEIARRGFCALSSFAQAGVVRRFGLIVCGVR